MVRVMSCERYWREGALLADRGEPDPHRETCEVCRREHEAREQIIRALPLVGSEAAGDPAWQARVWSRIAQLEAPRSRPARSWWYWGGGAVALGTAMLLWWMGGRREMPRGAAPMIELIPGGTMRSASLDSPSPGDRVRLSAHPGEEARIYRAGRLVLRCAPGQAQRGPHHELTDAPPETVKTPLDRLAEAFPGSELVNDD